MRILIDSHHSGAARAQYTVLHERLGHEVYFPNEELCNIANKISRPGDWLAICNEGWKHRLGGFLVQDGHVPAIGMEEFLDTKWDAVLMTRTESEKVFQNLLHVHEDGAKIKRIAMTGNDGAVYDWNFVPNFMSTDYLAFIKAPKEINKIWYSQEIGAHFGYGGYREITQENLRTVASYVNCFPSFTDTWEWDAEFTARGGFCPHCYSDRRGHSIHATPFHIWTEAQRLLPNHQFREYGINCRDGMIPECELPRKYYDTSCTIHMKTYDGYGLSMLQSIACGRPVIVPRGFHRYRTAGKYLIDHLTCFECEWTQESVSEKIAYLTDNVERANRYGHACYTAALGLFNWELESKKVQEFLEKLI